MVKHATSHGLSIFMCTLISAVIVELFKPLLPDIFARLENFSTYILDYVPIPISVKSFSVLLIASVLGVFWGIFFKLRFVK
jgi:hypothetical protein